MQRTIFTISDTSPASAITVIGDVIAGLLDYDWFTIDGNLTGGTNGTLDVYLQREVDTNLWADWLHFPQLSAGQAATQYSCQSGSTTTIHAVEQGTDASAGTPALAVNTFIGGHPGNKLRAVYVAGASTSAGAAQVIKIIGWKASA